MSNPAVTELCRTKFSRMNFWMDDNIGESIHIHIDEVRVDLTNAEFERMFSDICLAINALVNVEGFDCRKVSPDFLVGTLLDRLVHLRAVKLDNVPLREMVCSFNGKYQKIPESETVKMFESGLQDGAGSVCSENIGKNNPENLLSGIKNKGYPFDGRYIVMFGDDNAVRDGQDLAACLWLIQGDVSVPVLRYFFDKEIIQSKQNRGQSGSYDKLGKKTGRLTSLGKLIRKLPDKTREWIYKNGIYKNYYTTKYKFDNDEVQKIFKNR